MSPSVNGRARNIDGGLDQLAAEAPGRKRDHDRLELDGGRALGEIDGMPHRLLGLGEIDHRARLHAARSRYGRGRESRRHGCAAAASPAAHAAAAARSGRRSCWCPHRAPPPSRCAWARSASSSGSGHGGASSCVASLALALVFSFSLSASSRACAAASLRRTVTRSGNRRSIDVMSRRQDLLVAIERDERIERARDVGFRQAHVEAVLEPQVPAPFGDQRRGPQIAADLRIAIEQCEEFARLDAPRPARPRAASR